MPTATSETPAPATMRCWPDSDAATGIPLADDLAALPFGPSIQGYEILEVIGAGGMGIVVKARHRRLNRVVALKMLGPDSLGSPLARRRFQDEAETVARLQHPNIIQVFDVGALEGSAASDPTNPFLSLEYVDGGSLYRRTLSPQPPAEVARLIAKVARAVHAAHRVGVVHRDLKPANVLLTSDGEPKVADFGLAKQMESPRDPRGRFLTQHGVAVGTPEYMAPEQVDGHPPTPAVDIYSLGVILYELLTARVPFKGASVTETMLLTKYQEPVSPRRLRPDLPRDLETICLKCLEKWPEKRYSSAEELADDLTRWAEGRPIRARPVSGLGRLGRWAKRNPTAAMLAGLAAALFAAGVGGVTWKWRDAEASAREADANARDAHERTLAARWELYRANVAVAAATLERNALHSCRQALDAAPEEHRNWEWRYYSQLLDTASHAVSVPGPELAHLGDEVGPARLVTHQSGTVRLWDVDRRTELAAWTDRAADRGWHVAPDGRAAACCRGEREVVVRDIPPGTGERTVADPRAAIRHYRFARNAPRLLTVAADGHCRVWDRETGAPISDFSAGTPAVGVCDLSPDGRFVATHDLGGGKMTVWAADTGARVATTPRLENLFWVRFTPDGTRLVVNEAYPSCVVRLWDTRTGAEVAALQGHTNNVKWATFSPDGTRFATASLDQTARLWDVATGRELAVYRGHTGAVLGVAFSPDGRRLATAAEDQTVRVWDAATDRLLTTHRGHTAGVLGVVWTSDGTGLASAARDNTVRFWDARPEASGVRRGHGEFVYEAAFHPDARRTATAAWDGTVRLWDADGREVKRFDDRPGVHMFSVAFHPNGRWVAALGRDDAVRLWEVETGRLLHVWAVKSNHWKSGRLAFHPTSDLLACGGTDGSVRVFEAGRRTEVTTLTGHTDAVRAVAFSPCGRWLVSAADHADRTARVWDTATWKPVAVLGGHGDCVYCVAFSRDGRTLATGGTDGKVRLWHAADWSPAAELRLAAKVYGLAFSADGSRLACGCADNAIRLWDVARRQEVAELRGHGDYVHSVAFSPTGDRLVSASGDKTVRVWNTVPAHDRRPTE